MDAEDEGRHCYPVAACPWHAVSKAPHRTQCELAVCAVQWGHLSAAYLFMTETVACSTLFLSFFYWTFLFSPKVPA